MTSQHPRQHHLRLPSSTPGSIENTYNSIPGHRKTPFGSLNGCNHNVYPPLRLNTQSREVSAVLQVQHRSPGDVQLRDMATSPSGQATKIPYLFSGNHHFIASLCITLLHYAPRCRVGPLPDDCTPPSAREVTGFPSTPTSSIQGVPS
jgi:hypothetical protein